MSSICGCITFFTGGGLSWQMKRDEERRRRRRERRYVRPVCPCHGPFPPFRMAVPEGVLFCYYTPYGCRRCGRSRQDSPPEQVSDHQVPSQEAADGFVQGSVHSSVQPPACDSVDSSPSGSHRKSPPGNNGPKKSSHSKNRSSKGSTLGSTHDSRHGSKQGSAHGPTHSSKHSSRHGSAPGSPHGSEHGSAHGSISHTVEDGETPVESVPKESGENKSAGKGGEVRGHDKQKNEQQKGGEGKEGEEAGSGGP
ncbi:hypothetical protein B0H67DRAFT_240863 [Lasiosphaeris hirsuta]|uniref:Uncharacterized protein n=1 Tax=Lasiosphaeris hirsuta TaxID=260670 RepID=A0AA40DWA9_9PEZI|nr:hypothetical protein B0H67DRAFT_240863 [Lasiosphaeris hirsuta]